MLGRPAAGCRGEGQQGKAGKSKDAHGLDHSILPVMIPRDGTTPLPDAGSAMTPAYVRVLVIEVVVLGILFWLGRHFS